MFTAISLILQIGAVTFSLALSKAAGSTNHTQQLDTRRRKQIPLHRIYTSDSVSPLQKWKKMAFILENPGTLSNN